MRRLLLGLSLLLALALTACGGGASSLDAPDPQAAAEPQNDTPAVAPAAQASEPAPKPARERKLVVLDPGHGGDEVGSAANGVVEKASNLDMALRVETLLLDSGVDVLLTRRADVRTAEQIAGYTAARSDIQARIDLANQAAADAFVSIHSNGSTDAGQRGVEVWYDGSRAFASENLRLAFLLKERVLAELRQYGYAAQDRGLFDGQCFRQRGERCVSLFVLGGARETSREEVERRGGDANALGFSDDAPIFSRPAVMPGALVELLIVTNPADAVVLRDEAGRQAMARGVAAAVLEFLAAKEGG